jgi:hypothetical protein
MQPPNPGKSYYNFFAFLILFYIFSYHPIDFRVRKPIITDLTVEPVHAPVIVTAAPIPPIPILAWNPILPLLDLPSDAQPFPKTASFIPIIADTHPLEPIPNYGHQKPLLIHRKPRLFTKRSHKPIKNSHTCHRPVREFIPNSVCPDIMPKHICEVKYAPKFSIKKNGLIYKPSLFMVSFNTFQIGYSFGGNTGYTRENAYMEAARCLRVF